MKDDIYILVQWPESQHYMTFEWFAKEAYLCISNGEQEYFDSAYFIPSKYIQDGDK